MSESKKAKGKISRKEAFSLFRDDNYEIRATRYERQENSSTLVESIRQIHPFYAKRTQFWLGSN